MIRHAPQGVFCGMSRSTQVSIIKYWRVGNKPQKFIYLCSEVASPRPRCISLLILDEYCLSLFQIVSFSLCPYMREKKKIPFPCYRKGHCPGAGDVSGRPKADGLRTRSTLTGSALPSLSYCSHLQIGRPKRHLSQQPAPLCQCASMCVCVPLSLTFK